MRLTHVEELPVREIVEGCSARFVHSDSVTLAYWELLAGHLLPEHSHPHEQVTNVLSGRLELTVDGETRVLEPGSVVVIPPNALHSARPHVDTSVIDVFHPIREDYRE